MRYEEVCYEIYYDVLWAISPVYFLSTDVLENCPGIGRTSVFNVFKKLVKNNREYIRKQIWRNDMIKPIVKDLLFLGQKSETATKDDRQVITDLQDTLKAHRDGCVGMAANMIGYKKRMIIVSMGFVDLIMINPEIISQSGQYETEEGCLSLEGKRRTKRYKNIEVKFYDKDFKIQKQKFSGYIAQIIQHECDHLEGIII